MEYYIYQMEENMRENGKMKKKGYERYYYLYGDRYEGEWKNDKKGGYSLYNCSNGAKYEAQYRRIWNILLSKWR